MRKFFQKLRRDCRGAVTVFVTLLLIPAFDGLKKERSTAFESDFDLRISVQGDKNREFGIFEIGPTDLRRRELFGISKKKLRCVFRFKKIVY